MSDNSGRLVRGKLWFDGGFAMVPNTWARDTRITNQARGLLVQLVSHEVGFEVTVDALTRGAMNGRDAIRAQVGELERAGYLKRYRRRVRNRIAGVEWELIDPHAPVDNRGVPLTGFAELDAMGTKKPRPEQAPENQSPENQSPENQSPENPTTIEDQLKEHLTSSRDSTTEQPVDNSPSSAHGQSKIEPQSGTPSGEAFDLAASLRSAGAADRSTICSGRRGNQPHQLNPLSLRCEHCGERPASVDLIDVNEQTGEVA